MTTELIENVTVTELVESDSGTVVAVEIPGVVELLEVGVQGPEGIQGPEGPQGPQGPAGAGGNASVNVSAGGQSANLTNFVLSNSNGLSFGLNGTTITGSHNGLTSQSLQTQGMASILGSSGDISFGNANGITFGGNNSTLTASHNALTSQSGQALSGSNGSLAFQTATFGNLNGLSFYTSNGSIVGSYTVPSVPAQSVQTQNMVSLLGSTGDISFGNANGITFGGNQSTLTASHNALTVQSNQTLGGYAVSNTTQQTSGTFDARSMSFRGAGGVSVGISNGSVVVSGITGGGGGLANINVSAGGNSEALSAMTLANSNGVSFGINASVITATVKTDYQSSGNYLTTAMQSNAATISNVKMSAGTQSGHRSDFTLADSNGISFGLNNGVFTGTVRTDYQSSGNYLTTAMQSNAATISNINLSAGTTSRNLSKFEFNNGNGISFGLNGSTITASHNGLTDSSPFRHTSADSQLQFTSANSNFLGTGATQSFRHTSADSQLQFTSANSKFAQEWQLTGNTAGTTSSVQGSRWNFSGGNMLTISGSSNSLVFSVNSASLLGTGATASFRHTSADSQLRFTSADSQLQFTSANSNFLGTGATQSFRHTSADSQLQFTSANTKFMQEWSLVGNVAGTVSSVQGSRVYFSGGNNVTLSGSSNSIVVSAFNQSNQVLSMYAASNTTQSSTGTANASSMQFAGAGIASVGITGGSVVISVPAGGGAGDGGNIIAAGTRTAGSNSSLLFSNANNFTFGLNAVNGSVLTASYSQSVQNNSLYALGNTTQNSSSVLAASVLSLNALGAMTAGFSNGSIQLSAPVTSSLSATGAVSISTNGSTISIGAPAEITWSYFNPQDAYPLVAGQHGQATLHFQPMQAPNVQFDRIALPIVISNSTNSSGSQTLSYWVGIYTRNVSTLSLASSTSSSFAMTQSGTAGSYSQFGGQRLFTIGWTDTLLQGQYYLGIISRTTSGGTNASISHLVCSQINSNFSGIVGVGSAATAQQTRGLGYYTASTTALPSSAAFSQINGTNSMALRQPAIYFVSQTF